MDLGVNERSIVGVPINEKPGESGRKNLNWLIGPTMSIIIRNHAADDTKKQQFFVYVIKMS